MINFFTAIALLFNIFLAFIVLKRQSTNVVNKLLASYAISVSCWGGLLLATQFF